MPWKERIERHRQIVEWETKDIPPDLMLAIIEHESNGTIGREGSRGTKCAMVPIWGGGEVQVCRAYGLTQLHPRTVISWNKVRDPTVYWEDISGKDERAARLQVRLGAWYFAHSVKALHQYDPKAFPENSAALADANQLKLALMAYARGWGALKEKLGKLREAGEPLTADQIARSFPNWGRRKDGTWINRPVHYATTVWERYLKNQTASPSSSDGGPKLPGLLPSKDGSGGLIVPIGAMALLLAAKYGLFDRLFKVKS